MSETSRTGPGAKRRSKQILPERHGTKVWFRRPTVSHVHELSGPSDQRVLIGCQSAAARGHAQVVGEGGRAGPLHSEARAGTRAVFAFARSQRVANAPRGRSDGFTLIEVIVAGALLGVVATTVLGGLLIGMTEARRGQMRAAAAAWVQAELDYLRLQGYSFLADDVVTGTRTLTQTTGYTTYADVSEPRIPAGFDRAVIQAEDVPGLPVRKLTVTLYERPESQPYTILSTYVANFTYAAGP